MPFSIKSKLELQMKAFSILVSVFVLGCSNGEKSGDFSEMETPSASYEMSSESDVISEEKQELTYNSNEVEQAQKIIKTARLVFETPEVETTHKKILQLANQNKGLVQSDNSGKDYNRIFKNLIIRVPTENFQQFIDGISEGVSYFDQKDISRQDVSEEFVDLEARLKAKRILEERYLELLKKANNVKEMLEIERELSTIREEIEAKQGRLQYLQSQVSMSTVNIEFYKLTAESGITQSYGQKMKNALHGGWNGVSLFLLGILYLWPLFIFAIIIIIVIRIFLKRKKEKNSNT